MVSFDDSVLEVSAERHVQCSVKTGLVNRFESMYIFLTCVMRVNINMNNYLSSIFIPSPPYGCTTIRTCNLRVRYLNIPARIYHSQNSKQGILHMLAISRC